MDEKSLSNLIQKHAKLYYNENAEIADNEFDQLVEQLKTINPQHSYFDSVGVMPNSKKNRIHHKTPMLSLDKVKDLNSFQKWMRSIQISETELLMCEPKIDGVSGDCHYSNGQLQHISTRGNGYVGLELDTRSPINHILKSISIQQSCHIRGEFYIPKSIKNSKPFFNKPLRNICSGLINRMVNWSGFRPEMRCVHFIPYQIVFDNPSDEMFFTVKDMVDYLENDFKQYFNLILPYSLLTYANIKKYLTVELYIKAYLKSLRTQWNFETDGLVFVVNDKKRWNDIDKTRMIRHHHHYTIAWKPPSEQRSTILSDIEYDVSRLGRIIPVGILKSIIIGRSEISRVTLNNIDYLKSLNLHKNDIVVVEKANDIIPRIVKVLKQTTNQKVKIPKQCPSCRSILVSLNSDLVCPNADCKEKCIKKIMYWVSKNEMDDIGEETIRILFDAGCQKISDLYKRDIEAILKTIPRFGPKRIQNIVRSIQQSKNISEEQMIARLGIPGIGSHNIRRLKEQNVSGILNKYFFHPTYPNQGERYRIEKEIIQWLKDERNRNLIMTMKSLFSPSFSARTNQYNKQFYSITGQFEMDRKSIIRQLEKKNYTFKASIDRNTKFLLRGKTNSQSTNKLKKAQSLGIPVYTNIDAI